MATCTLDGWGAAARAPGRDGGRVRGQSDAPAEDGAGGPKRAEAVERPDGDQQQVHEEVDAGVDPQPGALRGATGATRPRQVGGQRAEVADRPGRVRALEALLELLDAEPPLAGRAAEEVGGAVAVGVG